MPACATCNSSTATLRCGACSAHQAPDSVVHYCNKICQKAHWSSHQENCRLARIYARVRHIKFPEAYEEDDNEYLQATGLDLAKLPLVTSTTLIHYLDDVGPEARPRFLNDLSQMRPIPYETAFSCSKDEYALNWEARVPEAVRDLWGTEEEYKIPFDCRPILEATSPDGSQGRVIAFFPQDFEILSFKDYQKIFGGGKKPVMDPWLKTGVETEMGLGAPSGEVRVRAAEEVNEGDEGDEQVHDNEAGRVE